MWYQDPFGFPINARPFSAVGTLEQIEMSEVLSQIVRRACLHTPSESSKGPTLTTLAPTTRSRNVKIATTKAAVQDTEEVLLELVKSAPYPDLVSFLLIHRIDS